MRGFSLFLPWSIAPTQTMKKEIVLFATLAIGILAPCTDAHQAIDATSPTSIVATTVNDLAADPSAYLGQVAVIGVVAAVKAGQGFTIVDKREYADCGLSCLNEPDTRKIPVRWDGDPPKLQQTVRITGVLEKSDHGLIFSAKNVAEAAKE
jgi:starvation-inducible outer membrane lipoprotein